MNKSRLWLPKLRKLSDIRDYILLIETLELQKLENTVSIKTKAKEQKEVVSTLKMVKDYYGQLTDFVASRQAKNRESELEEAFTKELAEFTHFWEQTMGEFKQVSQEEVRKLVVNNKQLSQQVRRVFCLCEQRCVAGLHGVV
jgi:hypothetical protein